MSHVFHDTGARPADAVGLLWTELKSVGSRVANGVNVDPVPRNTFLSGHLGSVAIGRGGRGETTEDTVSKMRLVEFRFECQVTSSAP